MDKIDAAKRSWTMRRMKGRDTAPERRVRSLLHAMGCRFRLQRADLPGKPDIVLPKHRTAVFVHGCFWHRHPGCKRASTPAANAAYWNAKFARNVERDAENRAALERAGWRFGAVVVNAANFLRQSPPACSLSPCVKAFVEHLLPRICTEQCNE